MKIFPIDYFFNQILGMIFKYRIFILVSETGSGKTTRIPFFLYFLKSQKNKMICCSQPRRIATISVAKRISNNMKTTLGSLVGYKIRFEDLSSTTTQIKFVTDGILAKEFLFKPFLDDYSILILDEIHERNANTDLILILCKNLLEIRSDLNIIITSATLQVEKYSKFFFDCPIFSIPGRCFPIKIYFKNFFHRDFLSSSLITILKVAKNSFIGDILVFLTGKEDIDILGNLLNFIKRKKEKFNKFIIIPIYSGLSIQIQTFVFKKFFQKRKIILSTNITETSITIPGISIVIDCGLIKQKIFNPYFSIFNLITTPISQNNAIQRAGRAGRNKIGKCFRTFSKWSYFNEMRKNFFPEIQRIDTSFVILFLKGLGIKNLLTFEWLNFPSKIFFFRGIKLLYSLGTLSKKGNITTDGRKILELPIAPSLGKVLLKSQKFKCTKEILIISAMEINYLFFRNFFQVKNFLKTKTCLNSDHIFLLQLFLTWEHSGYSLKWCRKYGLESYPMQLSKNIYIQLKNALKYSCSNLSNIPSYEGIIKCFLTGYFFNLAKIKTKRIYQSLFSLKEILCQIHPYSILNFSDFFPGIIFYNDLVFSKKPFFKVVSTIKKNWLKELIIQEFT
jgi:HrpA-like RNA helicase